MYGISFPDKKMLKVWKENQEKVRPSFCAFAAENGAVTKNYSNLILGVT
jgi:hypothetical protein